MKGLCHACLRTNVDVNVVHGKIICDACLQKKAKN